jgi:hypothetical protein
MLDTLDRFGIGLSLNTSSGSKSLSGMATGTQQGTSQQVSLSSAGSTTPSLAGVFAKFVIIKPRAKLPDFSTVDAASQIATFATLLKDLNQNDRYSEWQECTLRKMEAAQVSERTVVFMKYYSQIVGVLLKGASVNCSDNPSRPEQQSGTALTAPEKKLLDDFQAYIASSELVQAAFDDAVNKAAAASVLSLEYDFNRPQNQPTNSTIKLVGSYSWPAPKAKSNSAASPSAAPPWTLTYNAGTSLYNSNPVSTIPGASVLRDVQFGVEVDYNVASSKWPGLLGKIGDTTASASYYFQYQSSPSILNVTPGSPLTGITIVGLPSSATQVFTQKGNISVAQLKYGFGKGTNVKFPIAVTYSNRTELIAHPAWGLQFGVSYDFSSLLGAASTGK